MHLLISLFVLLVFGFLGHDRGWGFFPVILFAGVWVWRIAIQIDPYGAEAIWSDAILLLVLSFMAFIPRRWFTGGGGTAEHQRA